MTALALATRRANGHARLGARYVHRRVLVCGEIAAVELKGGQWALIDTADVDLVAQYSWRTRVREDGRMYAVTASREKSIFMHRLILGLSNPKILTDHRNHDGLDNRRENIRPCSNAQNQWNSRLPQHNTTGFKGVERCGNHWNAVLFSNRKRISDGPFATPREAALAYDRLAIQHRGTFAATNNHLGLL